MLFVKGSIRRHRLDICSSCEHYVSETKSCGTLGVDALKDTKTCGCFMPVKAKLKMAECPYGKWSALVTDKDVKAIKTFLGGVKTSLTSQQVQELERLYAIAMGQYKQSNGCGRCARGMIKQLQNFVENAEKKSEVQ